MKVGTWGKVRGPASGVHLLLGCRGTKYRHKGERVQADNTKPGGIKLHHSQKSLLDGTCGSRLSPGGLQYITKDIKDRGGMTWSSFTDYLYCPSAKELKP